MNTTNAACPEPAERVNYEQAVQREFLDMAIRVGALTGELRVARITLAGVIRTIDDGWQKDELAELVTRIDQLLAHNNGKVL